MSQVAHTLAKGMYAPLESVGELLTDAVGAIEADDDAAIRPTALPKGVH
jgi:hypothetical protein